VLDVVVTGGGDRTHDLSLQFFKGHGDGTFSPGQSIFFAAIGTSVPGTVYVSDFNGDGHLDVIVYPGGFYYLFLGHGDGTFAAPAEVAADKNFSLLDVNHDGRLDMIATTNLPGLGVSVSLAQPDGSFRFLGDFGFYDSVHSTNPFAFLPGDFNGDGNVDFALSVYSRGEKLEPETSILFGKGDGTFVPSYNHYVVLPVIAFDADGDGKDDLLNIGPSVASTSFYITKVVPAASFDLKFRMQPLAGTAVPALVRLNLPSLTDTTIDISSPDGSVAPFTVNVPAGQIEAPFPVSLAPAFTDAHPLRLTAAMGTETVTASESHINQIGRAHV